MLLATTQNLAQDELDDLGREEALVPRQKSHQKTFSVSEAVVDELSFAPPNQESVFDSDTYTRIHRLVSELDEVERNAIRYLFFKGLSHPEVLEKMHIDGDELDRTLRVAFAKLHAGLLPLMQ
jgi:DNA-directed RNA polymerase specialized sigma24 family protein